MDQQAQPVERKLKVVVQDPALGEQHYEMSMTDTCTNLYTRVDELSRTQQYHLMLNAVRLPRTSALLSDVLAHDRMNYLTIVMQGTDDVTTIQYMCEKCGNIWWRPLPKHTAVVSSFGDDTVRCPQDNCRHGIILKCRKKGTQTTYDAR